MSLANIRKKAKQKQNRSKTEATLKQHRSKTEAVQKQSRSKAEATQLKAKQKIWVAKSSLAASETSSCQVM